MISGPLLVIHGESDTTIDITLTEKAIAKTLPFLTTNQDEDEGAGETAGLGVGSPSLEFLKMPHSDHTPTLTGSQWIWLDWISARFAGLPVTVETVTKEGVIRYAEERVRMVRPVGAYQGDLNWFIQLATESYETD